jgi:hypothetical protein
VAAVWGLLLAASGPAADAVILPAQTIDGPSQGIVSFGGAAMAADGTGGLVYLKRSEGTAHVFVSRFVNGEWQPPMRVDAGESFAASWPRIGAAEGGELVVVWATPYGSEAGRPVDELLGATLGPGASGFGPAKVVDPDIRFGAGASPDLAMSTTGQADVVYRVLDETPGETSAVPLLRPGDVAEEVRLAHFEGETWARLGAVNRNLGVSMRPPTGANAPEVAIGPTGNGVVVWQEPEITGVARIWARRVFGKALDYVLPVSAAAFHGAAVGDDADAPSVAFAPDGQADVAYRQAAGPGSPLPGPRIFLNTLPSGLGSDGTQFAGASIADEAVPGGAAAGIGPPTVDIDQSDEVRLVYDAGGAPHVITTHADGTSAALTLGSPFTSAAEAPASLMDPEGGGISAWPSGDSQGAGVAVREDFPAGGVQTALLRGGGGGPVSDLAVGQSGLGDGLVAFMQGALGDASIVAAHATAPPARFLVSVPSEWVNAAHARVSWLPAPSTNGPVTYAVVRDGIVLPVRSGATQLRLDTRGLASGVHLIQVLATDANGQATLTRARSLQLDDQPPTVHIHRARGRTLALSIIDPNSGVNKRSVWVSWGDGARAHGRALLRHRYPRAGIYTIVVRAGDRVGNRGVVRHMVSVG